MACISSPLYKGGGRLFWTVALAAAIIALLLTAPFGEADGESRDFKYIDEYECGNCGFCGDDLEWGEIDAVWYIKGTGPMWDFEDGGPWGEGLYSVIVGKGVTSIGDRAFAYCDNLKKVKLSSTIESIGSQAFFECEALKSISIPDSVKTIGTGAFTGTLIGEISATGVETLADGAFDGKGLSSAYFPSLRTIGSRAFYCSFFDSISLPCVETVGDCAFMDCYSLATLELAPTLTRIGSFAFSNCTSLSSVEIPSNVTYIGEGAFSNCESLDRYGGDCALITDGKAIVCDGTLCCVAGESTTEFSVPDGVERIGDRTFYRFMELTSVTVPSTVSSIGNEAFKLCKSLTSVTVTGTDAAVPASGFGVTFLDSEGSPMTVLGPGTYAKGEDGAFYPAGSEPSLGGLVYDVTGDGAILRGYDTDVVNLRVPGSIRILGTEYPVVSIAAKAFYGCATLETVDLGAVKDVGTRAFYGCPLLKSVSANMDGCTIGSYAFYNCPSLKSISLAGNGIKIGACAFYDCTSLTALDISGAASIGTKAFAYCGAKDVSVPGTVKKVGDYAFYRSGIRTLEVCDGVSAIGKCSFYGCTGIKELSLPATLKTIGEKALTGLKFYDENGARLSATVECLSGLSFAGTDTKLYAEHVAAEGELVHEGVVYAIVSEDDGEVSALRFTKAHMPYSLPSSFCADGRNWKVVSVGDKAFYKCTTLRSADLSEAVTVGSKAFAYCTSLTSVTTGDGLASIGGYAFFGCSRITSFAAGASLETVGMYAFAKCNILTDVDLGQSLKEIGKRAFSSCPALKSLSFPQTLKTVRSGAFSGVIFLDADGSALDHVSKNLRGHVFAGSGSLLHLVA